MSEKMYEITYKLVCESNYKQGAWICEDDTTYIAVYTYNQLKYAMDNRLIFLCSCKEFTGFAEAEADIAGE